MNQCTSYKYGLARPILQVSASVDIMRAVITLLALGLAAVAAVPTRQAVVVGGSAAVVSQYPSIVALLYSSNGNNFNQACGGTIITTRAILTAAHCVYGDAASKWRARVGSSWANSGGTVYALSSIVAHPSFNTRTLDNDVAILRTTSTIVYSNVIKAASIAGLNYNLADNQVVWAAGWGNNASASPSEQLRHVQAWTISQATCTSRYAIFGANVTANMLCSGWLGIGVRDQCQGDAGGPLYHNGILVGICSWGYDCANAAYPGVTARVSRLATWIQSNA